ncbi:hypothetical protein R3P38DRAFT_3181895 [Favolaschia claudopus]|uniref:Uncharacterized protein n=1 Tax=Favolaschia claudopus TaxID=2862362 RepID=A0AAW0CM82_9AGAR
MPILFVFQHAEAAALRLSPTALRVVSIIAPQFYGRIRGHPSELSTPEHRADCSLGRRRTGGVRVGWLRLARQQQAILFGANSPTPTRPRLFSAAQYCLRDFTLSPASPHSDLTVLRMRIPITHLPPRFVAMNHERLTEAECRIVHGDLFSACASASAPYSFPPPVGGYSREVRNRIVSLWNFGIDSAASFVVIAQQDRISALSLLAAAFDSHTAPAAHVARHLLSRSTMAQRSAAGPAAPDSSSRPGRTSRSSAVRLLIVARWRRRPGLPACRVSALAFRKSQSAAAPLPALSLSLRSLLVLARILLVVALRSGPLTPDDASRLPLAALRTPNQITPYRLRDVLLGWWWGFSKLL